MRIVNDQGETVYQWSKGRAFVMLIRQEEFGPEEPVYGLSAPLGDLPPGKYLAIANLTTEPPQYQGQVAFEIVRNDGQLARE